MESDHNFYQVSRDTEAFGLRLEILLHQFLQMIIPFMSAIAIIVFTCQADLKAYRPLTFFSAFLAIGATFFVGRMDFIIHRVASYFRNGVSSPYERWKEKNGKPVVIALFDIGSAIPILASFIYNQSVMYKLGVDLSLVVGLSTVFLFALVMVPVAVVLAKR